jgi:SAM-dependent methyltransferase
MELNDRDELTRRAWTVALEKNKLLYPDERVVAFLARRFPDIDENRARNAIDIGVGSGRHLKLLLDYGFRTFGIDYTEEAVSRCCHLFEGRIDDGSLVHGDFRSHEFPLSFDAIIAWGVVFLTPPEEMTEGLRAMGKMLAPGGRLFTNFRTKENFHFGLGKEIARDCYILDERSGAYNEMCYTFTDLHDVNALVAEAGLKVLHVEKTTFLKNQMSELHSWLQVEIGVA